MMSTKRGPISRLVAGAATATVALGLLGAAAPAVLAADHSQDIWWYNNHQGWPGNSSWHDDSNSWRYRDGKGYVSYRHSGGRPYYYAPPPIYYHAAPPADAYPPAYVGPASLTLGFTL